MSYLKHLDRPPLQTTYLAWLSLHMLIFTDSTTHHCPSKVPHMIDFWENLQECVVVSFFGHVFWQCVGL